ncbi:Protein trichome birefringence-like 37 [Abeliophyllum distichum]|uniref:Protein trichome birefringence-like 37 n=1 Tax=Abeliophyllum distichum TaxID=126358 RepID=A0ABD1QJS7_9LAMI
MQYSYHVAMQVVNLPVDAICFVTNVCSILRFISMNLQAVPLYESSSCPFIDPKFHCQKYGRPDNQYLEYSWKPDSCSLSREWGSKSNCVAGQQPLKRWTYPAGSVPAAAAVNRVLSTVKKPIYLLDITTLSQLRTDAHPTTYSGIHLRLDCSHWCLPGLPDTWNQLYMQHLLYEDDILSYSSGLISSRIQML